jgi:hypothetical protein
MTEMICETDRFAAFRARNELIRTVRERLKGKGLDTRELENDRLVISSPRHPEKGRVYLNLRSGEVSHRRTIWDYLGHLDGHAGEHETPDSFVTVDTIIGLLSVQDGVM